MKVQSRLMQARFIEIHQVFPNKKERSDTFLTIIIRTHILLAINWSYLEARKNSCMLIKVQSRLMQTRFIEIHQVFAKKK